MKTECTLKNYKDNDPVENIVIRNVRDDFEKVEIEIDGRTVRVIGGELTRAATLCSRL